jgi:thioredoxin reductase (NADPH)
MTRLADPIAILDAVIIGAGPAGLTAASYLGRFHRTAVVIDGGASRARWIPESHNIPGFPRGIGGDALLGELREQAARYGAGLRPGQVDTIERSESGFRVHVGGESILARTVLLATGVQDQLPELAGAEQAVLRSLLRICPICDAFEATGKRIAVIGSGEHGDREARFLRTYSNRVTLIHVGAERTPAANHILAKAGVDLIESQIQELEIETDRLVLRSRQGLRDFDVFYSALGCTPRSQLVAQLGANLDESGALRVDAHQQTSISGIYAAGDNVRGLNQVVVAAAEAAIAATNIHNQLRTAEEASLANIR